MPHSPWNPEASARPPHDPHPSTETPAPAGDRLRDLDAAAAERTLNDSGLWLQIGPFSTIVRSRHPAIGTELLTLYADFPARLIAPFAHFHVEIGTRPPPAGIIRPQARFLIDGFEPFKPLPAIQALPLFEWGLNWAIATHIPDYMIIHAAVVARNDDAIVMPGVPGAGKSTLCAALVASGWRLLSDEFALFEPRSLALHPIPRPISLKNDSISIISRRWPEAWHSRPVKNTTKGTVALFRPPGSSVRAMSLTAHARWIIFPRYSPEHALEFDEIGRARALASMIEHIVNFAELPKKHFDVLDRLFSRTRTANLVYSDLDEAIAYFNRLTDLPPCFSR